MNKELRFSWGHILAFLALIFIAYVTFMGITYFTLGNFRIAGIGTVVCVILLATSLLGAQIKKGTPTKFYKAIIWERILLLVSPVILALAFYPYNHFWSVLNQEDDIVSEFNTSISSARGIFDEYETYAYQRIHNLSSQLKDATEEEQENRIQELTLLLLSENYTNLKSEANSWIDNATKSSTVWNVFLFGNIDNIASAVEKWSNDLSSMSAKHLACENNLVEDYSPKCAALQNTIQGLEKLKSTYSNTTFKLNGISILTMAICFLMLLCPYFIQEPNAANCERFWDFGIFSRFFDPTNNPTNSTQQESSNINNTTNTTKTGKGAPV